MVTFKTALSKHRYLVLYYIIVRVPSPLSDLVNLKVHIQEKKKSIGDFFLLK